MNIQFSGVRNGSLRQRADAVVTLTGEDRDALHRVIPELTAYDTIHINGSISHGLENNPDDDFSLVWVGGQNKYVKDKATPSGYRLELPSTKPKLMKTEQEIGFVQSMVSQLPDGPVKDFLLKAVNHDNLNGKRFPGQDP